MSRQSQSKGLKITKTTRYAFDGYVSIAALHQNENSLFLHLPPSLSPSLLSISPCTPTSDEQIFIHRLPTLHAKSHETRARRTVDSMRYRVFLPLLYFYQTRDIYFVILLHDTGPVEIMARTRGHK